MSANLARIAVALVVAISAIGGADRATMLGAGLMKAPNTPGARIEVLNEAFRDVLAPDTTVRLIAEGLEFTEGPVWIEADGGALLFSDISADTIYRWTERDGLSVFRKPSHNANGNATDARGRLVTCQHGSRTVTRTEKDGQVATIASTYNGKRLNSPNDVVVKSDGTIWFTDPPYGIKPEQSEQPANYVFRLDPGAAEPVPVAEDFSRPNGLCFSPDEKYLYVADSDQARSHIRRFRVRENNTLAEGLTFAVIEPPVPDGMRVDEDGRLYVTAGDGIQVFGPAGELLGKIRLPLCPANCTFGGGDRKTLYVTARAGVYAVNLAVRGADAPAKQRSAGGTGGAKPTK